ncbi:hypothetical protein U1Q18_037469, partial [Sarracenia purpurea var. burkii]
PDQKDPNPLLAEHSARITRKLPKVLLPYAEITGDALTCPSPRSPDMGLVFSEIAAPATPAGACKSRRNQNPNQRAPKSHKRKPVPRLFHFFADSFLHSAIVLILLQPEIGAEIHSPKNQIMRHTGSLPGPSTLFFWAFFFPPVTGFLLQGRLCENPNLLRLQLGRRLLPPR